MVLWSSFQGMRLPPLNFKFGYFWCPFLRPETPPAYRVCGLTGFSADNWHNPGAIGEERGGSLPEKSR